MLAHDLARKILEGPDEEIAVLAVYKAGFIQSITAVSVGSYPAPSWAADAGTPRNVVVLMATDETLNEDGILTLQKSEHD